MERKNLFRGKLSRKVAVARVPSDVKMVKIVGIDGKSRDGPEVDGDSDWNLASALLD